MSVFLLFCEIVKADPSADVYVDDDADPEWYDATHVATIQEGIDNVSVSGIVYIWDGIYCCEGIQVNKSVSLIGNGTATTHLEYTDLISGLYRLMYLQADNINISGLHFNYSLVTGGYQIINDNTETGNYTHIFNCLFTNSTGHAININPNPAINLHNINISNNEFYNAQGAITSSHCNNITIYNNTIDNITGAISLYCFYGEIAYNVITNTTENGHIDLDRCNNISVHHNTLMYGLWTAICLEGGTNNCTIYDNTIIGFNESGCYGVEIYDSSSKDNLFYNNYFNNTQNAYSEGENIWNTSKTTGTNIIGGAYLGGNYWSDYVGSDNTGDGIGDTELPYNSLGNIATGGDYLPLTIEDEDSSDNGNGDNGSNGGYNNHNDIIIYVAYGEKPIAEAYVSIYEHSTLKDRGMTDIYGVFETILDDGEYTLEIRHQGFETHIETFIVDGNEEILVFLIPEKNIFLAIVVLGAIAMIIIPISYTIKARKQ